MREEKKNESWNVINNFNERNTWDVIDFVTPMFFFLLDAFRRKGKSIFLPRCSAAFGLYIYRTKQSQMISVDNYKMRNRLGAHD